MFGSNPKSNLMIVEQNYSVQWNLSIADNFGTAENVLISIRCPQLISLRGNSI